MVAFDVVREPINMFTLGPRGRGFGAAESSSGAGIFVVVAVALGAVAWMGVLIHKRGQVKRR